MYVRGWRITPGSVSVGCPEKPALTWGRGRAVGRQNWSPSLSLSPLPPASLAKAWRGSGRNEALLKIPQSCGANRVLGDAARRVWLSFQGGRRDVRAALASLVSSFFPVSKVGKGLRQMRRPSFPSCWTFGICDPFLFSGECFSFFLSEDRIKNCCFYWHMLLLI